MLEALSSNNHKNRGEMASLRHIPLRVCKLSRCHPLPAHMMFRVRSSTLPYSFSLRALASSTFQMSVCDLCFVSDWSEKYAMNLPTRGRIPAAERRVKDHFTGPCMA